MKIGVMTRNPKSYTMRRFKEAAEARDCRIRPLNTLKFAISLEQEYPDLYYEGKPVASYDAIIPRIGASLTYFGTAIVRQFQQMNVFCLNSAASILNARDKLRSFQILSKHDLGIPATAFVRRKQDVLPAIERLGGTPVMIKVLEGTQGVGVILAETPKIAEAIIETLQSAKQNVLIQRFVSESKGKDIRAIVIGDRVVAAMRRTAKGQEYRSNVHRGGSTEAVTLEPEYERTAIQATQIMGLRFAGVDMLEAQDGPQIMEVNSSPGLEGIETACQIDVAGAIVDFVKEDVSFPELDVRQRLTVSKSYGVHELLVANDSDLVGKTVSSSALRERDIVILTIQRGRHVICNPTHSRIIEPGDRLVCFGKRDTLREMLPVRKRRRRPRKLVTQVRPSSESSPRQESVDG